MPKITREWITEREGDVNAEGIEDRTSWERGLWRCFPTQAEYEANENSRFVMTLDGTLEGVPLRKEGAAHSTSGGPYFADCDTYRSRGGNQTRYRFGYTGKRWQKKLSPKHYRPYYKAVGGQLVEITEDEAIEAVGDFPETDYADKSEKQLGNWIDGIKRAAVDLRDTIARSADMFGEGAYVTRWTDSRNKLAKPRGQYEAERWQRVPETRADIAEDMRREGKHPDDPSYGEWQDAGLTRDRQLAGNDLDIDAFETASDDRDKSVEDQAFSDENEIEAVWDHLKETGDFDPRRIQDDPPAKNERDK